MKNFSYLLVFFIGFQIALNGQTVIRFQPDIYAKNTKQSFSEEGKLEQIGKGFLGKLRVELPGKTLELDLKPSRLKQYDKLITSDGEIESKVEFYEDKNQEGSYFLAVIDKQFYSLSIIEKGNYFSLEKVKGAQFSYQRHEPDLNLSKFNVDEGLIKNNNQSEKKSKMSRTVSIGGCLDFPIGFVCDYAHYKANQDKYGKGVPEIEADNLINLAAAQESFGPYTFDGEIRFRTIGQVIFANKDSSPWDENINLSLLRVLGDMDNAWKQPESWKKQRLLIKVGITGIDYLGGIRAWGYGGSFKKEYQMGTVAMLGFLNKDQTRFILAHELGHVFGASHDIGIMDPYYNGSSGFSIKSKTETNATLKELDESNYLRSCPAMTLNWELANDSLVLKWHTNNDSIDDTFTLEYSADERKNWNKVYTLKSKNSFSYQFNIANKTLSNKPIYFRVIQQGNNQIISNYITIVVTEIEEELPNKTISIFPNPFDNNLTINNLLPNEIKIYSISGRLIKQLNQTEKKLLLDTSFWISGTYFIQIGGLTNQIFKVLKQ
jgi:hypothetical protein